MTPSEDEISIGGELSDTYLIRTFAGRIDERGAENALNLSISPGIAAGGWCGSLKWAISYDSIGSGPR
jgi:hypothetical protein